MGTLTQTQEGLKFTGTSTLIQAGSTTVITVNSNQDVDIVGDLTADNFSGSSSGTNTGDQTLPTLSSLGGLPLAGGTLTGATLVNAQLAVNSTTVNSVNKLEVHGQARVNGKMMIGDSTISNVPNAAVQLHIKNAGQAGIRLEDSDSSNLAFDVIVDEGVGFLIKETVGGDAGDDVRLTIAESTGAVTIGGTLVEICLAQTQVTKRYQRYLL